MKRLLIYLAMLTVLFARGGLTQADSQVFTMEHDGITRTYRLFLPETPPRGLLVALHAFGSSARALEILSGLDQAAGEAGLAVAYPAVAQYYWDDGRSRVDLPPVEGAVDDAGFIAALVDTLTAEYEIDPGQVWLTGMQNGGTMALALACQMPERFAGIAVVSALMRTYQRDDCGDDTTALNLLFVYGARDHIYKVAGNASAEMPANWQTMSAADTLVYWAERNGCSGLLRRTRTVVIIDSFAVCADGTQTTFVTVLAGGHGWFRMGDQQLNRSGVDASSVLVAWIRGQENLTGLLREEAVAPYLPRSYNVYVPDSYDENTPTPLVMLLHGRGGSALGQAYTSDMNRIAEREGFIALYPEGDDYLRNEPSWNYGRGIPFYGNDPRDDELFFEQLLQDLSQDLNIDQDRIYVTGYSNGGFMTQRLACTQPTRYAAFASVAATAPLGIVGLCDGAPPVPMLFIHGTADQVVPWRGMPYTEPTSGAQLYLTAPMDLTMGFWGEHNGCAPTITENQLPRRDQNSYTVVVSYEDCSPTAPLELYAVVGGGHVWHGIRETDDPVLGESNMDFNASEVIWEFFSQHTVSERETP